MVTSFLDWEWLEEADSDAESDGSEVNENMVATDDSDTEVDDDEILAITHSVTFKCI